MHHVSSALEEEGLSTYSEEADDDGLSSDGLQTYPLTRDEGTSVALIDALPSVGYNIFDGRPSNFAIPNQVGTATINRRIVYLTWTPERLYPCPRIHVISHSGPRRHWCLTFQISHNIDFKICWQELE